MKLATLLLANALMLGLLGCATVVEQSPSSWEVKTKTLGEPKVWVWKSDGSRQCSGAPKISLDAVKESFRSAAIVVYAAKMGSDGKMYPSICGAGTGNMFELQIGTADIAKALGLGYQTKSSTEN